MDTTDHGEIRTATRRRVLQALGLGGALAVVPAAAPLASAQDDATTTTAPPKHPTDGDIAILGLAQSAELAAVALYGTALGALAGDEPVLEVFRSHHQAYADSISAIAGRQAPNQMSTKLVEAWSKDVESDAVATLAKLEQALAGMHTEILNEIEGIDAAALVASIIPIEARHATVLATVGGAGFADLVPADGLDELKTALTPDDLSEA